MAPLFFPMVFECRYETPRGFDDLWMSSDGVALTGLWFEGSRGRALRPADGVERDLPVFRETRRWLDLYFSGRLPGFTPDFRIDGLTPFREEVLKALLAIPYGETATYGEIAAEIARKRGGRMSAQAVGGAVGWNPVCIVVPCHRIVGADGSLTGYGGGVRNKALLLELEKSGTSRHNPH